MIGNVANVNRLLVICTVDGSVACTRDSAAFTDCSVWNILLFQSKKRFTSAEPRLVVERTLWSPGTLFTASSIGRVTEICICSIGITPFSTPIMIRGKFVVGNTEIGTENARNAPRHVSAMITKIVAFAFRVSQWPSASFECRRLNVSCKSSLALAISQPSPQSQLEPEFRQAVRRRRMLPPCPPRSHPLQSVSNWLGGLRSSLQPDAQHGSCQPPSLLSSQPRR